MTDKQIIIDEIDVSECEFYYKGEHTNSDWCIRKGYGMEYCDCIKDCSYKKCLHKEQECEESKTKLLNLLGKEGLRQSEKEFYEEQLDQLKAENEELKNFHINLVGVKECEIKELLKLKQTLTEIKEIATENSLAQVGYNPDWDIILQKISECEGNDE
jgi:hypothetical protein